MKEFDDRTGSLKKNMNEFGEYEALLVVNHDDTKIQMGMHANY
jgi:hypothetical protein